MKMRRLNLILFSVTLVLLVVLPIACGNKFLSLPGNPWHLSPFNSGDSLSEVYEDRYRMFDAYALIRHIEDTTQTTVSVMIDGWGVPYDENVLAEDFALFDKKITQYALHKRLLGHTAHAEAVEMRSGFEGGLFLRSGDSVECARIEEPFAYGMKQMYCCQKCTGNEVLSVLDSVLSDTVWKRIAWTDRETNLGDRTKLYDVLRRLAEIATHHPNTQFIIQGTHRPILGTPETRREYIAHWVPAVFINCGLKPEKN